MKEKVEAVFRCPRCKSRNFRVYNKKINGFTTTYKKQIICNACGAKR